MSRDTENHTPESSSTYCPELLGTVNLAVLKQKRLDKIWSHNASDFVGDGLSFVTPLKDLYSQKSIGELCLALPLIFKFKGKPN